MANLTISVPDAFIALYNQRKATYDAFVVPLGLVPLPPLTKAVAERWIRDYLKGMIRREGWRQAILANDTAMADADEAAMAGV